MVYNLSIPVVPSDKVASSFSEAFTVSASGSSIIIFDSFLTYPSRDNVSPTPMRGLKRILIFGGKVYTYHQVLQTDMALLRDTSWGLPFDIFYGSCTCSLSVSKEVYYK